jgi:hypothetical protein
VPARDYLLAGAIGFGPDVSIEIARIANAIDMAPTPAWGRSTQIAVMARRGLRSVQIGSGRTLVVEEFSMFWRSDRRLPG